MPVSLRQLNFRGRTDGPHLLITGGVHGDEFEPIAAVRKLNDILSNRSDGCSLLCGQVTLVPCVNEDAFFLGRRCGSDGLDLARTCPGKPDGTITEQTAYALSELICSCDFYIDLHTGGTELSVYPLAGYMLHSNRKTLDTQREMARIFGLPVVWGTSADLDGRSLSVARDADVPAIYCEYLGSAGCSQTGVEAYANGCLNVMGLLEMIDRSPETSDIEYHIEDSRPDSGHLQVSHPSPASGFFDAAVRPGEEIAIGGILGTVFDIHTGFPHTIEAESSGIVLVIRTFPRVRLGESVGVVLDTSLKAIAF